MLPSEDDLEQWNLDLLEEFGWARMYGRDIEPRSDLSERGDWQSEILPQRLTAAIAKPNPQLTKLLGSMSHSSRSVIVGARGTWWR